MIMNLDGFEKLHEGRTILWTDNKGSYAITDKSVKLIETLYVGKGGVPKTELVRVLINEYKGTDNEDKLKRMIGESTDKKDASAEA